MNSWIVFARKSLLAKYTLLVGGDRRIVAATQEKNCAKFKHRERSTSDWRSNPEASHHGEINARPEWRYYEDSPRPATPAMTDTNHYQRQIVLAAVSSSVILLLLVASSYLYIVSKTSSALRVQAFSSEQTRSEEQPEQVTICQLKTDPGKYNHRFVKVTGFLSHGFEDSLIFDPDCESRFDIWYEYGGRNSTGTMYCCGLTNARTRPKQVRVEKIPIPLIVDENFQKLDQLLHNPPNTIVHGTVIGRYFSGKNGSGYGHMGCCSLLMIQQVLQVDPHDRTDLDYSASADQPNIEKDGCGYRILTEFDAIPSLISLQNRADAGEQSWMLEDPSRVALETIANLTNKDVTSIDELRLKRQTQGRMVYEWTPATEKATYMVVISRPYQLSFYAKTDRVVWVPIAAYRSSCDKRNDVTRYPLKTPGED